MSGYVEIIGTIVSSIILVILLVYGCKRFIDIRRANKELPIDKRNRIKETNLLAYLLQDIKNNTQDWTYVGYNHNSLTNTSIINDRMNLAVIVRDGISMKESSGLIINYNLNDLSKYRETDPNTVSILIAGKHAKQFLLDAEDVLDVRGKEIDFFNNQIKIQL